MNDSIIQNKNAHASKFSVTKDTETVDGELTYSGNEVRNIFIKRLENYDLKGHRNEIIYDLLLDLRTI